MSRVTIIGAGLAGMSAAIELGKNGVECNLVSLQPSERAQSVLAEGGINAALDVMGDKDNVDEHYRDTMAGGVYLGDPEAVKGLTSNAPDIVRWLSDIGVPFNMEDGHIVQRYFGGQKKRRTAFAKSSTGKAIVNALIDEARKYEDIGLITRYPHHKFVELITDGDKYRGVVVEDTYTGDRIRLSGPVILASGGLNGLFAEMTTGTTKNRGEVTARVFAQGIRLSNLEMIQYHPTTVGIPGKRMLISEAARGEGGRLFAIRGGEPWYFMEEKYPELGNLMPRDVVSREVDSQEGQVYLDMRGLDQDVWEKKLPDLRKELIEYLGIDPKTDPVPIEPGIHYFMGGIDVDATHRTNMPGVFAAGECCSQYHGANRLGANSMLGAIYGGMVAARSASGYIDNTDDIDNIEAIDDISNMDGRTQAKNGERAKRNLLEFDLNLRDIIIGGLGIIRSEDSISEALDRLCEFRNEIDDSNSDADFLNNLNERIDLGEVILRSALIRKESRGAHYRSDYPQTAKVPQKTCVEKSPAGLNIYLEDIKGASNED